jgi:hypothetical protein
MKLARCPGLVEFPAFGGIPLPYIAIQEGGEPSKRVSLKVFVNPRIFFGFFHPDKNHLRNAGVLF